MEPALPFISRRSLLASASLSVVLGSALLTACSRQQPSAQTPAAALTPVSGGVLVYLEQQAHTNLYPPAGGFYPNGGVLN